MSKRTIIIIVVVIILLLLFLWYKSKTPATVVAPGAVAPGTTSTQPLTGWAAIIGAASGALNDTIGSISDVSDSSNQDVANA